jgi:hypothetical protein
MGLVENVLTRPRGRPPKAAPVGLTPIQAVLAGSQLSGLGDASDKVEAAVRAFMTANEALSSARSDEAKEAADVAVRTAQSRLAAAEVRAEIAERNGERDGPSPENLRELQAALETAKAEQNGFEPKIVAYKGELERRREILAQAIDEFMALLAPGEAALLEAADAQLALAAELICEARAAMLIQEDRDEIPRHLVPQIDNAARDGHHVGKTSVDAPEALRRAYRVLRIARDRVTSYRDPGDPM